MTDLIETVAAEVDGEPTAAKAVKLLRAAAENGWTENPYCSLVLRLQHPDGLPMFVRWNFVLSDGGKPSWRFAGARASNGQAMTLSDVAMVIEHPELIFPEPPENDEKEEVNPNDCSD
jgi:hypothetical protein